MSCRSVFCCLSNNYMISFKSSKCNIISQSQYDSEIRRICSCISSFPCPFCESCSLVFYGRYPRRICVPDCPEFIIIRVQRVFCTHCGRTHALLPDSDAPFSSSCFTCFCYCFSFSSSVLCFPEYLLSSDGQISIFTCQTVQKDFTGRSSSLAHFLSLPT